MGEPAARVGDLHGCPLHGVGAVAPPGFPAVKIGGAAAAHLTDLCVCAGAPSDPIAEGAAMVLIGGLPAARLGHKTLHGGPINEGQVDVLVGGPTFSVPGFITIEGTPTFQSKTIRDLYLISTTRSGQDLFRSMERSGKKLRIHSDGGNGNWAWTDPAPSGSNPPGYLRPDGTPGASADAEIGYSPDRTSLNNPPYSTATWAQSPNRPADVGLFHEMVHADDLMNGRFDSTQGTNTGPLAGTPISNSELRAAGLPPYNSSTTSYSENTYRSERGLPPRTFY